MKKILLVSVATLATLSAFGAIAADLPSRKAAPVYAPPPPMWTGFYAGLNAGYGFGTANNSTTSSYGLSDPYAFSASQAQGIVDGIFGGPGSAFSSAYYPAFQGGWAPGGLALANYASITNNTSGFVGGAQVGYNYQWGSNVVVGVEADIQGSGMNGSGSGAGAVKNSLTSNPFRFTTGGSDPNYVGQVSNLDVYRLGVGTTSVSTNLDWIGTVRGRLGYLVTPTLLVYGTGGFAYGNARTTVVNTLNGSAGVNINYAACIRGETANQCSNLGGASPTGTGLQPLGAFGVAAGLPSIPGGGRANSILTGWTAGGGAEWMFMPNWSLKAEAIYYDLGNQTVNGAGPSLFSPVQVSLPAQLLGGMMQGPAAGLIGNLLTGGGVYSNATQTKVGYSGIIARAGVNYHFNWGAAPVVASY